MIFLRKICVLLFYFFYTKYKKIMNQIDKNLSPPPAKTNGIDLSQYHVIQMPNATNPQEMNRCYIHKSAKINAPLTIGRESYINSGCVLGGRFPIKIGAFCSIAAELYCWTYETHNFDHATTYPLRTFTGMEIAYSEIVEKPNGVEIGNDVYIGHQVRIMPGVKIADGAVIAARSVVSKNVAAYEIVGGVPNKIIKKRFSDPVIGVLQEICWWNWSLEKIKRNINFFNLDLAKISQQNLNFELNSNEVRQKILSVIVD